MYGRKKKKKSDSRSIGRGSNVGHASSREKKCRQRKIQLGNVPKLQIRYKTKGTSKFVALVTLPGVTAARLALVCVCVSGPAPVNQSVWAVSRLKGGDTVKLLIYTG